MKREFEITHEHLLQNLALEKEKKNAAFLKMIGDINKEKKIIMPVTVSITGETDLKKRKSRMDEHEKWESSIYQPVNDEIQDLIEVKGDKFIALLNKNYDIFLENEKLNDPSY